MNSRCKSVAFRLLACTRFQPLLCLRQPFDNAANARLRPFCNARPAHARSVQCVYADIFLVPIQCLHQRLHRIVEIVYFGSEIKLNRPQISQLSRAIE